MKNYRNALCILVLLLTLVSPAFAGEIQHPRAAPVPMPTNAETPSSGTDGEMQTGKAASTLETDTVTQLALSLLQNLLPLF